MFRSSSLLEEIAVMADGVFLKPGLALLGRDDNFLDAGARPRSRLRLRPDRRRNAYDNHRSKRSDAHRKPPCAQRFENVFSHLSYLALQLDLPPSLFAGTGNGKQERRARSVVRLGPEPALMTSMIDRLTERPMPMPPGLVV